MSPRLVAFWVLIIGAALAIAFAPLPLGTPFKPVAHVFRVEARQFAYAPAEFRVNAGDTVTIQLVSTDVVHGLYVDGYGVSITADPGQTQTLTFVADHSGSFRLRCNVTCGAMHPFMIGKLTVGRNEWLYRSSGLALLALVGFFPFSSFLTQSRAEPDAPSPNSRQHAEPL